MLFFNPLQIILTCLSIKFWWFIIKVFISLFSSFIFWIQFGTDNELKSVFDKSTVSFNVFFDFLFELKNFVLDFLFFSAVFYFWEFIFFCLLFIIEWEGEFWIFFLPKFFVEVKLCYFWCYAVLLGFLFFFF